MTLLETLHEFGVSEDEDDPPLEAAREAGQLVSNVPAGAFQDSATVIVERLTVVAREGVTRQIEGAELERLIDANEALTEECASRGVEVDFLAPFTSD